MQSNNRFTFSTADLQPQLDAALQQLDENQILPRLWQHDHTLWHPNPDGITNRLDWLELPTTMQPKLDDLARFARKLVDDGFETAVLLGMGGSSLAPEVFKKVFGPQPGFLDLLILDTTDPVTIRNTQDSLTLEKTVFVVATKSGGTAETLSLFKYFYNLIDSGSAIPEAGRHFIAITDPGSKLEKLTTDLNFRRIFLNNPNLGGRFSALSNFGLVSAACLGIDLNKIIRAADTAGKKSSVSTPVTESPAVTLGALIAVSAQAGRDKLTFISNPEIASFSDWVEQLVAESTGKSGKGILPVVGEPLPDDLSTYGDDRLFVIQHFGQSDSLQGLASDLKAAGFPLIESHIVDPYQLGELILSWEIATAIAGHMIGIQPFNQPDVESAKVAARRSVQAYLDTGALPERSVEAATAERVHHFLDGAPDSAYIALQAYLPSSPEIESVFRVIQAKLRDSYGLAVTFGFGPRFLHSTGQLHKGDRGNGHFIQFVTPAPFDLNIPDQPGRPDSGITFDILKQAQAIGDGDALEANERKFLVLTLDAPLLPSLSQLEQSL